MYLVNTDGISFFFSPPFSFPTRKPCSNFVWVPFSNQKFEAWMNSKAFLNEESYTFPFSQVSAFCFLRLMLGVNQWTNIRLSKNGKGYTWKRLLNEKGLTKEMKCHWPLICFIYTSELNYYCIEALFTVSLCVWDTSSTINAQ